MKKIALVGCTGSIGRQVCAVVRRNPELFCFSALVAGKNGEELTALCNQFRPKYASLAEGEWIAPNGVTACSTQNFEQIFEGCDIALVAVGGFAGLRYTLAAIERGKSVALANKESLVCGGELVMKAVKERGVDLVPIDSEHSALFQALSFRRDTPFEKLILTASGGPFRHLSEGELAEVTAQDALKHPTWNMGAKITIDCATLLNKGYEVIEAKWLYDCPLEKIEAVVHPESIVHSLVQFCDGSTLAQLGFPTMEVPIQLALTYPTRYPCAPQIDLVKLGTLHFERLQREKFPCFDLAVEAGRAGGTHPTVLNAAAEEAVYAFLKGGIKFPQIAYLIEETLANISREEVSSFAQLKETDERARAFTRQLIYDK